MQNNQRQVNEEVFLSTSRSLPFLLLGFVILGIYVYFFVDFKKLIEVITQISKVYLLLAFLAGTLGLICYATAWHYLTKAVGLKINWKFTYPLTLSSVFFNVMIPSAALSGEVYRTYVISKSPLPLEEGIASIALHRVIAILPFIAGLTIGTFVSWFFSPVSTQMFLLLIFLTIFSAAVFTLFLLFMFKAEKALKIIKFVEKIVKVKRVRDKLEKIEEDFLEKIEKFKNSLKKAGKEKRELLLSITYAFLYWFLDINVITILFYGFNVNVPFFAVLFVYTVTILLQSAPLMVPGMIGFADLIRTEFFNLLGIPGVTREVALSVSLLTDAIVVFYYSLIGFFALLILNFQAKNINLES